MSTNKVLFYQQAIFSTSGAISTAYAPTCDACLAIFLAVRPACTCCVPRFSFVTTDGDEEGEVALAPEQVMSDSELFTPSFATNENPNARGDVGETSQATQADATVVFLQKARNMSSPLLLCIVMHVEG